MRYTLSLIGILFYTITIQAQTIKDVILTLPDDVILGLTTDQKVQLCADTTADSVSVDNPLNGLTTRLSISKDYASFATSDVGTIQIKILPLINDTKIICVVKTVCSDVCDSRIQFYTIDWKLLPEQSLLPKRSFDWFIKASADRSSTDYKEAIKAVDINPITYNLSPNDYSLIAYSGIGDYLGSDDYDSLQPFLTEKPKVFTWNKISFQEK